MWTSQNPRFVSSWRRAAAQFGRVNCLMGIIDKQFSCRKCECARDVSGLGKQTTLVSRRGKPASFSGVANPSEYRPAPYNREWFSTRFPARSLHFRTRFESNKISVIILRVVSASPAQCSYLKRINHLNFPLDFHRNLFRSGSLIKKSTLFAAAPLSPHLHRSGTAAVTKATQKVTDTPVSAYFILMIISEKCEKKWNSFSRKPKIQIISEKLLVFNYVLFVMNAQEIYKLYSIVRMWNNNREIANI